MGSAKAMLLAVMILAGAGFAESSAWTQFESGAEAYRKRDYKRAVRLLKAAESANSRCFDAAYYLGRVYEATGDPRAASAAFKRVPKDHSYHALAQQSLGSILLRGGKAKEALPCFRASVEARPSPAMWMQVCRIELDLKLHKEAEKSLGEAEKLSKGDFQLMELRGRLFAQTDRPMLAVAEYDKLVAKFPGDYRLHHLRALCLVKVDRTKDAARAFERVLKLNPVHQPAMRELIALWDENDTRADEVAALRARYKTLRENPPKIIRRK